MEKKFGTSSTSKTLIRYQGLVETTPIAIMFMIVSVKALIHGLSCSTAEQHTRFVKVFYIEDDKTDQYIVGKIIQLSGGAIQFNTSGFPKTIIPRLRIFRPHIILMDLMLAGGINGFDTAREIHRIGISSRIPIVAVSSSDTAIEIPKARRSGMQGVDPKTSKDRQRFPVISAAF